MTAPNPRLLLQHLYTGVIWVSHDLRIAWVNTQTEQILSVSASRLIGLNIIDLLLPVHLTPDRTESIDTKNTLPPHQTSNGNRLDDSEKNDDPHSIVEKQTPHLPTLTEAYNKLQTQFHNAQYYQQPFIEYNRQIRGIHQPLDLHYSVTPVEQEGLPYFLIEIWHGDRRNRLDKEQQLQEQHDVSREMLRSVAHEVKNPLAGIRGAAQLLIRQARSSLAANSDLTHTEQQPTVMVDANKLTTYANIVISETDRLTKLIEQLLGSNQLPEFALINIHQPLEHVLLLTQTQHPSVNIKRDYDLSLPELMADNNQLIQVFLNLVNNACEAMLEQDSNTLSADYQPQLTITTRIEHQYTIGTVHHKQVIKVSVQDNGAGISHALIGRIFFPLVTARANGTGLGLALVQEIVHRHQGSIEVASQPGDTQFTVYLPLTIVDPPSASG
ncbi:two-component system sensor histidine kinase NtrB [Psychrobacter sp. FDAARGOS_221]|uniref:two-component system sensor histidine kinase NtrB n=1 Tax=Psychrobacter sp. FDAARGOS_221 TaxID=1975705 RepID=UPI000BB56158|nr:ATP-binding protein [Psychrobacter sp. FDAARGOS_221]PNK61367.1 histidine kinase [Psychrobacter sp. FDAARGOS_221]